MMIKIDVTVIKSSNFSIMVLFIKVMWCSVASIAYFVQEMK